MNEVATTLIMKYGLIGVFITTLVSYSIIPFPSEAAIIAATFFLNPIYVGLFAFAGGTIGSLTNYYIGKKGIRKIVKEKYKETKWKEKAKKIFSKFGPASIILFSNFPLIGDPLMIIAGSFDMKIIKFLIYSSISKIIYIILVISLGKGLENLILG